MNIGRVKGREFVQYYENFRTELLPEIQEGFITRGHPRSAQRFLLRFHFLLAVSIFA